MTLRDREKSIACIPGVHLGITKTTIVHDWQRGKSNSSAGFAPREGLFPLRDREKSIACILGAHLGITKLKTGREGGTSNSSLPDAVLHPGPRFLHS